MNQTLTQSRIITTDSAQQFLNGRQVITPDIFTGVIQDTPTINLKIIDRILNVVKKWIKPENISEIPNWNKSASYIFSDCDIWLITEKDINSTVKVFNRFTRMEEDFVIQVPASKEEDIQDPHIDHLLERLNEIKQECSQIFLLLLINFFKYLHYCVWNQRTPDKAWWHFYDFYSLRKFINILMDFLNKRELDTRYVERAIRELENFLNYDNYDNHLSEHEIDVILDELLSLFDQIEWRNRENIATYNGETYDLTEILGIHPRNIESLRFWLEKFDFLLNDVYRNERDEISHQLGRIMPVKSDWLAFYNDNTGAIFMLVDRISKEYEQVSNGRYSIEILFQEILLHELIHSSLDLYPRSANSIKSQNIIKWNERGYSEESLDNAIVLEVYRIARPSSWIKYLREIMSNQSFFYRNALELENTKEIKFLLEDLINYKLHY